MPSGIIAAGSPAQCYLADARRRSLVSKYSASSRCSTGYLSGQPGQVLQRRKEGRILDIKLPFDLNNRCRGHSQFYVPASGQDAENRCRPPSALPSAAHPSGSNCAPKRITGGELAPGGGRRHACRLRGRRWSPWQHRRGSGRGRTDRGTGRHPEWTAENA